MGNFFIYGWKILKGVYSIQMDYTNVIATENIIEHPTMKKRFLF
jgi:hypothetical protein